MGDTVNIHVTYTRDLKRMFRLNLRLRRWTFYIWWAVGGFFLLGAVLVGTSDTGPHRASAAEFYATLAVLLLVGPVAAIWAVLYLNRRSFVGEVDVTVTDQMIIRRTTLDTMEFGWDKVRRVLEGRDLWIFVVNFFTRVAVYKSDLNAEQRAELEAFLARRRSELSGTWTSAFGP
jgi:hypothetical protein